MNFIERIFHVAPDGGTGSLEMAIILVLLAFTIAVALLRKKRASLLSAATGCPKAHRAV